MSDNQQYRHVFGGFWTQEKLGIVDGYLKFYTTALKNFGFNLYYADAFAGTGKQDLSCCEKQDLLIPLEELKGSVARVLDVGGFDGYFFNDINPSHCKSISSLIAEMNMNSKAKVTCKDANIFVKEFCANLARKDRALLFIDPYKHELEWDTLEVIAKSEKIDLWLLVPIGEILRLAPKDQGKLTEAGTQILTRLLGSDEWLQHFYEPKVNNFIDDLFGDPVVDGMERVQKESVEAYITRRLGQIFSLVLEPYPLKNKKNSQLFSLYFCISNPEPKAKALARKVGSYILNKRIRRSF